METKIVNEITKRQPNLPFFTIWNISFGFLGVQMAYGLQSANMSRVFQTLGADPSDLSLFWILPPLAGLVIQPIVGYFSDKTWFPKLGRRIPYLFIGAIVAVIVMVLFPHSGSFGFDVTQALIFGAFAVMFLDLSSNVAMQPFKMLVGDMVNEKQKTLAYSVQSFLSNLGNVLASVFPYFLAALGVANVAAKGVVPDSVIFSFYVGAALLIVCCLYSALTVKELNPEEYARFHGFDLKDKLQKKSANIITLLKKAPSAFWTIGLVQFFCWAAFLFLWTYSTSAIALNVWGTSDTTSNGFQDAGNWFGILSAVQAVGAVLWSLFLPLISRLTSKKAAYCASLVLGAFGFGSIYFMHGQYELIFSFILIGIAWSAMMTFPFTILTNSLEGEHSEHMGSYLGLFNGTICLPQIVAAIGGKMLIPAMGGDSQTPTMFIVAAILIVIGAFSVWVIKEKDVA
ncbi:MAG: MFS transporter [Bifidobacteriaceae bacterium]|jgi:maltose/moltooligosaccharide transporter|nr:MFS transporter [Bifidobacteriaceae bacterium]